MDILGCRMLLLLYASVLIPSARIIVLLSLADKVISFISYLMLMTSYHMHFLICCLCEQTLFIIRKPNTSLYDILCDTFASHFLLSLKHFVCIQL